MKTVFGVEWHIATRFEVLFIIGLVLLVVFILVAIKYLQHVKNLQIHDSQLFLFKLRRQGFSNFQIKIINNMVDILRLSNPLKFLDNPGLFESAVGKFLTFLKATNEKQDSFISMCSDIIIIYDRLYYPEEYKKPLSRMIEIGNNEMLYFLNENKDVYLAKVVDKTVDEISIKLFRGVKELKDLDNSKTITAHIPRIGDAEYLFTTKIKELQKDVLVLEMPLEFSREKEYRHPYIDVIIPCTIREEVDRDKEPAEPINGTVFKLNDHEVVIRLSRKLDYRKNYSIEFEIMDFKFTAITIIIANRTIEEKNILYYTFKFKKISDSANQVLKKFITEHL